ncbi:Cellulose synthase [Corchorus olitorius]|uniref:Cellulose synthase n=1 Tax=Corchorus olitorius TaxID=93759 RepID=A0A1R3JKX8_9ROSI|nr:Cellulose synthase [Corchorus olitorius]
MENSLPLHVCHVPKFSIIFNRSHTLVHSIAIAFLIYYRVSFFFQENTKNIPTLPWLLVFASELLLSFAWLLGQAFRWRPISRTVFPERLPSDDNFPGIDVFICTADPDKEPTVGVMNTVISAMALDYPPEKLHIYLSDDGGSDITLHGMKEAWKFARSWLPFCRRFDIKTSCPEVYFSGYEDYDHGNFINSSEFKAERQKIEEKYDKFKERVEEYMKKQSEAGAATKNRRDHPSNIQIIQEYYSNEEFEDDKVKMPLLVYVAREKRPSHHHHFKAGALNVLLRVSALMSNSPYILVLDCDMFCNDPTSARQAMCCHLDPQISPSLAFVQFPQTFRNISKDDIYDSEIRYVFKIQWQGLDGLRGPVLSGTNFYIKREALLGNSTQDGNMDLMALKRSFGPSNEFIKTLRRDFKPSFFNDGKSSTTLLEEAKFLASCSYQDQTTWGTEANPKKEPPLEVMNTVLSAMALDYPTGKLSVYVSDDGGSALTLHAMREAWIFAKSWLPFCRKFGVKTRCPKVYFSRYEDECLGHKQGYEEELEKIKVIQDEISNTSTETNQPKMPCLVYVSREKSPTYPHHFKAGALNVLLRVSSIISNSPYILVLDCDMRCNDPTSALQAMCFHLDPKLSSNLAFVQFPQKFHNLSKKDIYDGQLRSTFSGPMLSGTGFYLNRKALFGDIVQEGFKFMVYDLFIYFRHVTIETFGGSSVNRRSD